MSPKARRPPIGTAITLGLGLVVACFGEDLKSIRWEQEPRLAAERSKESHRPVMLYVAAESCGFCRKLEKTAWADPAVTQLIHDRYIPLKIDGMRQPRLVQALEIDGFPAVIVLSPDGVILGRVDGYVGAREMLSRLKTAMPTESTGRARMP